MGGATDDEPVTGRDDTRVPEPLTVDELAEAILSVPNVRPDGYGYMTVDEHATATARAVLGLIGDRYVLRAAVLDLAQRWEDGDRRDFLSVSTATARRIAELRALTEQENRP